MKVLPSGDTDVWLTHFVVCYCPRQQKPGFFPDQCGAPPVARGHARPFSSFPLSRCLFSSPACVPSGLDQSLFIQCLRSHPLPHPLDAKGTSGCGQHSEPVRGGPSAVGVTVPSEPGTDRAPATQPAGPQDP